MRSLQEYIITICDENPRVKGVGTRGQSRGTLALQRAASSFGLDAGRQYCLPDDIKRVVIPVFAHRVMLNAEAYTESSSADAENIMQQILSEIPVPL